MPSSVEGMVSLRGSLVPVIDLAKYAGIVTSNKPEIMIVTEYNGHTQGFWSRRLIPSCAWIGLPCACRPT
jgi:chemotaxis signal transduction protein